MKKSIKTALILAIVLAVIITGTVGCFKKSPRQVLLSAFKKNSTITSNAASGELELLVSESGSPVPEEPVKITFNGAFQKQPDLGEVNLNLSIQDMGFEVKMYTKNGKTWLKLPLISAYLLMDQEQQAKKFGIEYDAEKQKELSKKLWQDVGIKFINFIPDSLMTLERNNKTPEGVGVDTVKLDLDQQTVGGFIDIFLNTMSQPEFKDLCLTVYGIPKAQAGGLPKALDLRETLQGLKGRIKVEDLKINLSIDKSGYIRQNETFADFELLGDETNETMCYYIHLITCTDEIDKEQNFDFPDLSNVEIISVDQFGNM
jgi:hypothetical protein